MLYGGGPWQDPARKVLRGLEGTLTSGAGGYRYSARSLETMAAAFAAIWRCAFRRTELQLTLLQALTYLCGGML